MSESDIRNQCPEAQAKIVIQFLDKGWEVGELESCGEVRMHNGGDRKWITPNGHAYP